MSDTVVVLKGDSTDLVSAMKKGGAAMGGMKDDSKKLTDQLKQVADQADVAAGKLVNQIGGTGAIKAIGGIGVAFTGVNAVLGALSGSMNAFYASQGKEGADAMNRVNTAVDTLQGTLFQAATGGLDAKESADLLVGALDTLTTVATVVLTPLREFVQLFFGISEDAREAAKSVDSYNTAVSRSNESSAALKNSMGEIDAMMLQLTGTTEDNTRATFANARVKIEAKIEEVNAAAAVQNTIIAMTALASKYPEIQRNAEQAARTAEAAGIIKPAVGETYAEAREKYAQKIIDENVKIYVQQIKDRNLAMVGERGAALAELEAQLTKLNDKEAEVIAASSSPRTPPRTSTGGGGGRTPPPKVDVASDEGAAFEAFMKKYSKLREALLFEYLGIGYDPKWLDADLGYATEMGKFIAEQIKQTGEEIAIEKKLWDTVATPPPANLSLDDDPEINRFKMRAAEMTAVMGRYYDWREIRDAETNDLLDDIDAESTKSRAENIEVYMKSYGQAIAEQIDAGASAAEIMEMVARKAMANVISFIGDEAMAKGAVMAASGNPMAIAMFAAGTAAYATAAYLGSTAKKATVSTPASSNRSEPGNSTYNLRVDATFADGESIARRFAEMQKAASQRGLIPAYAN